MDQAQKNKAMEILRMQIDSKVRFFEVPSKAIEAHRAAENGILLGHHVRGFDLDMMLTLTTNDIEKIRGKHVKFINKHEPD